MDVRRLRLLIVLIAAAVVASGVALAASTDQTTPDPAPPIAVESRSGATSPSTASTPSASLSATPAATVVSAPAVLLPDARSLPAGELSIETSGGDRRLRFSATLANDGPGPLEVFPIDSQQCPAGQRYAEQRLYVDADDDGAFDRTVDGGTETRPAGCMVDHPDHEHWHFDAMARYALTPVGSTTPVAENTKVSFCLRDNVPIPGAAAGPPEHYGECDTRLSVQGISPGWADVYTAELADQVLDLPAGLADGAYCLHTEADPLRLLQEVDPTDNAAVLTVQITGTSVEALPTNQCRPLAPLD